MKKLLHRFTHDYPLFRFNSLILEDRLSIVFLLTGLILSSIAVIITFLFGGPFWINLPNILIALLCFFLPIIYTKELLSKTIPALFIVGCVYFPFLYFTNQGNTGSAPLYFIMILIYFSFYLNGKKLIIVESFLVVFYSSIMTLGYLFPSWVIPYDDALTETIDLIVAVVSISITISIISVMTFKEYKKERNNAELLLKEVNAQKAKLEDIIIKDQLTNTYTKQYFTKKLVEELELSKKTPIKFFVMMIDIDDFKFINDTFGHLYGDDVLIKVANTIHSSIREHDLVARYGGEEFSVLITHNDNNNGYEIAERIRQSVSKLSLRHNESITISIGVTCNQINDNEFDIIKRADDLLYSAKRTGKNRVMM